MGQLIQMDPITKYLGGIESIFDSIVLSPDESKMVYGSSDYNPDYDSPDYNSWTSCVRVKSLDQN